MTQRDLAAASDIKQPMIARIERASQTPKLATLARLLRALDASLIIEPDGRIAVQLSEAPKQAQARSAGPRTRERTGTTGRV